MMLMLLSLGPGLDCTQETGEINSNEILVGKKLNHCMLLPDKLCFSVYKLQLRTNLTSRYIRIVQGD